ncbi:aminotransferase class I/II-fold pyridoxal phosphate-dependent enzyme [Leucobacter komagatae]|uniref:Amino acid decarboxylase n=1 Tax=Leucobacter komagatae TaxID=55969 RepID=A0A0D0IIB8_9MICO|nr:amino acid decarboxylase [Leucobacter komagatae]KIP51394.1 amino acid decarboxylase [Leucobacter komagatae]
MTHTQGRGPEHERAPYAEALRRHAEQDPLMFMVPGHAATPTGMSRELADFLGERALRHDIPQLVDGIDSGVDSPLEQAVTLAADAWGARRAWFLANGSSQGNRMAVIAVGSGGATGPEAAAGGSADIVVAQRSAHSSFLDGLVVTGLAPEWAFPEFDEVHGINHGLTPETLEASFARASASGERLRAAYVISPSYFGAVADIAGLAAVAHAHGVPLIVDAAWGAHFGFHEDLPEFPTRIGADIVVTSTHKMGGSLGQSAMLLLAEGPFAAALEPALERAFNLTQTTSASSLLLGSLDIARRSLVLETARIGASVERAERLRGLIRDHDTLTLVSDDFPRYPSVVQADPLRVSIGLSKAGMSGYEMRAELARSHGILLEIATAAAVVAFLGPGKELDVDRLFSAMQEVLRNTGERADAQPALQLPSPGRRRMTPRAAYFAETEVVPAEQALGRVSADALAAYPPGIPNIAPGEEITREAVAFLREVAASPIGFVRGALDPAVSRLRVVLAPCGESADTE